MVSLAAQYDNSHDAWLFIASQVNKTRSKKKKGEEDEGSRYGRCHTGSSATNWSLAGTISRNCHFAAIEQAHHQGYKYTLHREPLPADHFGEDF
jgi:hypothetical protein